MKGIEQGNNRIDESVDRVGKRIKSFLFYFICFNSTSSSSLDGQAIWRLSLILGPITTNTFAEAIIFFIIVLSGCRNCFVKLTDNSMILRFVFFFVSFSSSLFEWNDRYLLRSQSWKRTKLIQTLRGTSTHTQMDQHSSEPADPVPASITAMCVFWILHKSNHHVMRFGLLLTYISVILPFDSFLVQSLLFRLLLHFGIICAA